jgi:hypothetical protein
MTPVNLFTSFSTFRAKNGGEISAVDFQGDVLEDDTSLAKPIFTSSSTFGAKDGGELPSVDFQGDVLEDDPGPHRTYLHVPVPLEPRTAVSSLPWNPLRMTPTLAKPIYKLQYLWSQGRR